jgi:hypothetical protein
MSIHKPSHCIGSIGREPLLGNAQLFRLQCVRTSTLVILLSRQYLPIAQASIIKQSVAASIAKSTGRLPGGGYWGIHMQMIRQFHASYLNHRVINWATHTLHEIDIGRRSCISDLKFESGCVTWSCRCCLGINRVCENIHIGSVYITAAITVVSTFTWIY